MSAIESLEKYLDADFSGLGRTSLEQIRTQLQTFEKNNLKTVEDHQIYLKVLAAFRSELLEQDRLHGENYPALIQSILSVGDDGIYSSQQRFLYELIQNVDDCEYDANNKPELSIHFDDNIGRITLEYNELGFTPFNVFAITGIAEMAKNISEHKVEIGEKGIGFKSVFGIADRVLIQSGMFSFSLYRDNFTVPVAEYDDSPFVSGSRLTLFVNPKDVFDLYSKLEKDYCKAEILLNNNPILFLNKLTTLRLHKDSFRSLCFSAERCVPSDCKNFLLEQNMTLSVELKTTAYKNREQIISYTRYRKKVVYSADAYISRYGKNYPAKQKSLELQVVVPSPDSLYNEKGTRQISKGRLYSFLPTQIQLSVPMVCHVPFKLDGAREYVDAQGENKWFLFSCTSLHELLKAVYLHLAETVQEDILLYLPNENHGIFVCNVDNTRMFNRKEFKNSFFTRLPIFFTSDGAYECAEGVCYFSLAESIADPVLVHKLLSLKKSLLLLKDKTCSGAYGIEIIKNVNEKLFATALENSDYTQPALAFLSSENPSLRSSLIEKYILNHTEKPIILTEAQVTEILNCLPWKISFQNILENLIKASRMSPISISIDSAVPQDILSLIPDGEPLVMDDFDTNARRYLLPVQHKSYLVDEIPSDGFFPTSNGLILPKTAAMEALGMFCNKIDTNCTLGAMLALRTASDNLNKCSGKHSDSEYFVRLRRSRNSIKRSMGDRVYKDYIKLINESSNDESRWLNELLQNADDCKYPQDTCPTLKLRVKDQKIELQYNELGFSQDNLRAITSIGESTKKRLFGRTTKTDEIGEKGIGFKTVFSVADSVEICSGSFHFKLTKDAPTVPEPLNTHPRSYSGTTLYLKPKSQIKINTEELFSEANILRLCLCLRNLRHLTLNEQEIIIEDKNNLRTITIGKKRFIFHRILHEFQVPPSSDHAPTSTKYRDPTQQIICYIPKTRMSEAPRLLYAGLPTKIKLNIPLSIDAPFELTTTREDILGTPWSRNILPHIYEAIIQTMLVLRTTDSMTILRFLHIGTLNKERCFQLWDCAFLNNTKIISEFEHNIRRTDFLPTYQDNVYVSPEAAKVNSIYRFPEVFHLLAKENMDLIFPVPPAEMLSSNMQQYDIILDYLGVPKAPIDIVFPIIKRTLETRISEDVFRDALYRYFESPECSKKKELDDFFCIPVKGKSCDSPAQYFSRNHSIYFVQNLENKCSPSECWFLDISQMDKDLFNRIFKEDIPFYNKKTKKHQFRDFITDLVAKLDGSLSEDEQLEIYQTLLSEFRTSPDKFDHRIQSILCRNAPLRNKAGHLCTYPLYTDKNAPSFHGEFIPSLVVHEECADFAKFIGYKDLKGLNLTGNQIHAVLADKMLAEKDIEDLQNKYFENGIDILRCLKKRTAFLRI